MAFKIGNIFSTLSNSTSAFDSGTGEFLLLDVDAAKHNLNLAERAAENDLFQLHHHPKRRNSS